jgi:hypothetical protein
MPWSVPISQRIGHHAGLVTHQLTGGAVDALCHLGGGAVAEFQISNPVVRAEFGDDKIGRARYFDMPPSPGTALPLQGHENGTRVTSWKTGVCGRNVFYR